MAGTVYSWTTEEGTTAFTDDPKRIPAKYKDQVERRTLGKLRNYPQFTESKVRYETPYAERVAERLEKLREPQLPAVSAPPPGQPSGVRYGVGIGAPDNDQVSFPVGAAVGEGGEPFVTTEQRIKTRQSIATQDVQVTRQGDEIVSVRISPRNQRKVSERASPTLLDRVDY